MSSKIQICNMALTKLTQNTITAIDEDSNEAENCSLYYDVVLESLLRQFPWNFASKTYSLTRADDDSSDIAEATLWGFIYTYPANALAIRNVFAKGQYYSEFNDHEIISTGSQKFVCSNIPNAYARCTIKITDPTMFDALFVPVFANKLAVEIAMPLGVGSNSIKIAESLYQEAISKAMLSHAIEGAPMRNRLRNFTPRW